MAELVPATTNHFIISYGVIRGGLFESVAAIAEIKGLMKKA
jgi:hypothetical protein